MEQRNIWRNITGTVCVLGLAVSATGFNSTLAVKSLSGITTVNYNTVYNKEYNSMNYTVKIEKKDNIYFRTNKSRLELEAKSLFGKMREATTNESMSVSNYVKSISKDMEVNFFDIC